MSSTIGKLIAIKKKIRNLSQYKDKMVELISDNVCKRMIAIACVQES